MPVTVRLAHRLHETLGEDSGGDLVTWMQTVDANRAELREVVDNYWSRTDSRFRELETRMDSRFAQLEAKMDARFAQFETLIERQSGTLLRWSFGFWVTTLFALFALTRR